MNVPPTCHPILVVVTPFPVEESVHEKDEIAWVVIRIFLDRFVGLPGMHK